MDLFENPFHILGATPLDNIRRIEELAEKESLLSDADVCMNAKSILTNPRHRISAEVAWLPGVNPTRANELVMLLESSAGSQRYHNGLKSTTLIDSLAAALSRLPYTETCNVADEVLDILKLLDENSLFDSRIQPIRYSSKIHNLEEINQFLGIDRLNPIVRSNLLAARMARLPNYEVDDIAEWIFAIAQAFESINPEKLCIILNAERRKAGFSEIREVSVVAVEIQNRRNYYQQVIKSVLNSIYSTKERLNAIMKLVDRSPIVNNKNRKPILIDDTIDTYAVKTAPILENEEKNIKTQDQKLRYAAETNASDAAIVPLVDKLMQAVNNWYIMAQPILDPKKRLGFNDTESYRVAMNVRRLAIYLYNEHDKHDISQQILNMLQEVFTEVPTIVEHITVDLETLNKIAERDALKS